MAAVSTPINAIGRDDLVLLIRNNALNNSCEFSPDPDVMKTDSPMRKSISIEPVIKKLFHSPMPDSPKGTAPRTNVERSRKGRKRKRSLIPESCEKIKPAFIKECNKDGYSPEACEGMRKRVLISLFHNKEYSMDFD